MAKQCPSREKIKKVVEEDGKYKLVEGEFHCTLADKVVSFSDGKCNNTECVMKV